MGGMQIARAPAIQVVPALALAKGFKGYKPEEEKVVRKVQVVEDETLKKLKRAFRIRLDPDEACMDYWKKALDRVRPMRYSAKDVEGFSIALGDSDMEWFVDEAGLFLSALVNHGKDSDYVIHSAHLDVLPRSLGYENTKNIIVKGDVDEAFGCTMKAGAAIVEGNASDNLGEFMEGGSITVKGDAGSDVGRCMKGGTIRVEGNAGDWIGESMEGGSITVNGDAGGAIGLEMRGGEIFLEGDYRSIADSIEHGKIYHKGVLIVDK
ncbi:MAG: hypothetical protein PHF60_01910 [Candidatus ainarchaeum sp.]|nr:hypothetical protein [Candidatus ainarchaeum sp.]